ncbi:MAG TPA: TPM domain-containing protein [Noviherbaspirillum sp.]|uniref:TPM domain-containing protein n=1 Tax=Noviherbaspirillum sp. TaxID=1926288 RepID=UPI002B45A418|nr:TPM domain-containing protein [Noviherbaspirillum sp.]HJV86565.1 TPM domain-containing protein [Noviherbaspirillum sp.]
MLSLLHRYLIGVFLALAMSVAGAQDFVPVPPLKERVTDQVGMLTPEQRNTLENVLKEYEERTGSQIAVLLMSTTEPEAIEQYSIRVFDEWKLGRKGIDDGVLLIIARDNPPALRRMRIEAGRGVQGTLTDAQSKRILQDVMAPHFRQNDFYGGLVAGVSAITSLLDKERFAAPGEKKPAQEEESDAFSLGLFFFFMILFLLLSRARSRRYGHHRSGWGRSAPGVILGDGFGRGGFGGFGGGGFGGSGGGGFSGGGGTADGGGASGNW